MSFATRKAFTPRLWTCSASVEVHSAFSVALSPISRLTVRWHWHGKRRTTQRAQICSGSWPTQRPARNAKSPSRRIRAVITWLAQAAATSFVGSASEAGKSMVLHQVDTTNATSLRRFKRMISSRKNSRKSKTQGTNCSATCFTLSAMITTERARSTRAT